MGERRSFRAVKATVIGLDLPHLQEKGNGGLQWE